MCLEKPPIENVIDSSCAFVNQAEQFIFMYYIVIFETPHQPRYCIYPKYTRNIYKSPKARLLYSLLFQTCAIITDIFFMYIYNQHIILCTQGERYF